jgi:zinc transport system substrate-binding protein
VAGRAADVRLLLPPGVEPHSWEPKPSDIVVLSEADIFLYISDNMEPWAGIFSGTVRNKSTVSIEVLEKLDLLTKDEKDSPPVPAASGHNHAEDPHFWLNLDLAGRAVMLIAETMAESDPLNYDIYMSNGRTYFEKLKKLDQEFKTALSNCESRLLVTGGHAAFGYMALHYGLEQVSVYGLSPDAEPSPRHLAEVVSVVRENHIKTVFSEEFVNPRMAKVLSEETGTRVMILSPVGNLTTDQWQSDVNFIDIMRNNLNTLREGLHCE